MEYSGAIKRKLNKYKQVRIDMKRPPRLIVKWKVIDLLSYFLTCQKAFVTYRTPGRGGVVLIAPPAPQTAKGSPLLCQVHQHPHQEVGKDETDNHPSAAHEINS